MTRHQRYRRAMRDKMVGWRSGPCELCKRPVECEMAHVGPTPLTGRGRGLDRRYHDIRKHPKCYTRLCHRCHADVDAAPSLPQSRADLGLGKPNWP